MELGAHVAMKDSVRLTTRPPEISYYEQFPRSIPYIEQLYVGRLSFFVYLYIFGI